MARNYIQGFYEVINKEKYVGNKQPYYRSSWENRIMYQFDTHPSIINWASEPIKIPYYNPLEQRQTIYVPDFLIMYQHKSGAKLAELLEIKPFAQSMMREGKMKPQERATVIKNQCKWRAAVQWCKNYGLTFRVITEQDMFFNTTGTRR